MFALPNLTRLWKVFRGLATFATAVAAVITIRASLRGSESPVANVALIGLNVLIWLTLAGFVWYAIGIIVNTYKWAIAWRKGETDRGWLETLSGTALSGTGNNDVQQFKALLPVIERQVKDKRSTPLLSGLRQLNRAIAPSPESDIDYRDYDNCVEKIAYSIPFKECCG